MEHNSDVCQVYEDELTKELEPEPDYEPEPEYYSEEEREPVSHRMRSPPPMPFSSCCSYVEESSS